MASDPGSDRIALAVVTDSSELWISVWNGTSWSSQVAATTSAAITTAPVVGLAFEHNSGDLLAAYGKSGSNSVFYRTWTSGGGWSGETTGPNVGGVPNTVVLYADSNSDRIMLGTHDNQSDINFTEWTGTAWNSVSGDRTSNSGTTGGFEPFAFVWYDNNRTPVISTSSFSIGENNTSVGTVASSDADGDTRTYSISGGADQALFTIDANTGALSFIAAPNFENPTDSGANNVYDVIVRVSDGTGGTDSQSIAVTVTNVNEQPAFTSLDGTPTYTENGSAVVLDSNVTIFDAELSASNNFSGATLTLVRNGGANSQDIYSATGTLSTLTQGSNLVVGGTTVGTVTTNSSGTLVLTFNANATNALVNSVMQQIAYRNYSDNPPASVQINWTFNDNNSGAQGTGGALTATGSTLVSITAAPDVPLANDDDGHLNFDGTDDVVVIADSASLTMTNTLTMEAWINPDASANTTRMIINKEGEYEVAVFADNTLRWAIANTSPGWNWIDTGYVVTNGVWTHIAVTFDNGTIQTFVNGNLVHSYAGSGPIGDQHATLDELRIGCRSNNPSSQYFDGSIDDVRIWNVARTQTQIQASLDQTLVGNETGLVAYYRFNEASGTTVTDLSSFGNHGVLTNGVSRVNFLTDEDTSLVVNSANGVLANDRDGDGNTLTVTALNGSSPAIGSATAITSGALVTLNSNGSFTYNANGAFNYLTAGASATDTFTYTVSDGTGNSSTSTVVINITGVNDAPVLGFASGTANIPENFGPVVLSNFATVTDVDSANFDGGQLVVTVTANAAAEDRLTVRNQGTGIGQVGVSGTNVTYQGVVIGTFNGPVTGSTALTITFNSSATATIAQAVARNVTYENTSDAPSTATRTLQGYVTDGDGGTSNVVSGLINIIPANDAPTITNGATVSLTGTDENTASSGTAASTILTSASWADVDATPSSGLAIISTTGNGTWEFSTDGSNWTAFGTVSSSSGLLITSTTQVRFLPDGSNGSTATFGFKAWDQTAGTASTTGVARYADPGAGGGTTAYSSQTATASMTVTSLNDAPVLDNSGSMTLTSISEDATTNSGNTVASIIASAGGDRITDVDTSSVEGIAVSALNSGSGIWQYSLDGGTNWQSVGAVSSSSALLLRSTDMLRFMPNSTAGTTADFTFKAWDQTSGTAGARADVSTSGGTTAFGTASKTASIVVTDVNDGPSFAQGDGIISPAFSSAIDTIYAMTVQSDGKILAVGSSNASGTYDFAIARFNADGSVDTSFGGGDGYVSTSFGSFDDNARSVSVLADGRILVVGTTYTGSSQDVALAQYNSDGTLDTSFGGGDGMATSGNSSNDEGNSAVIQSDGKILVAGKYNNNNFGLLRFNSNGSLDTAFGSSGIVSTDIAGGNDGAYSIALQNDGKIVLGGFAFTGASFDFAAARYNADGTLDTTFSGDGKATVDLGTNSSDTGYSMTLQADNKILIAGWSDAGGNNDFALVRLNTDGALDTTFSGDGKVITAIGSGSDLGLSVATQADGKILVAGQSSSSSNNFGVVRYNSDGSLDTSFGTSGIVDTNFSGGSQESANAVFVQSDGKILLGGSTNVAGNVDFGIARYSTSGALDTRFDLAGTLGGTVNFTEGGTAVVLDSNVAIFDDELTTANNFSGATLTLVRNGGASSQDVYSASGTLSALTESGSLVVGGTTVGTVTTNSSGTLVLTFNSNATNALVNSVMRQIAYSNSSDAPPASAQINWTFNDGNSGAQGTGGALTATGNTTVNITAANDQAAFTSLNGTPTYIENGSAVVLDSNVTIFDAELSAANNFSGATLTLVRNGGANSQDVYSATGTLSTLTQGGNLVVGGTTVGTVTTNSSGTLGLTFNSNATNTLVNSVMQQIGYSNSSEAPPSSAQINWTFNDNNSGAQGTGGALTATGSIVVTITAVNDAPILDNTGAMTLTTITEDQTSNSGLTVASIILSAGGDRITDVDSSAIEGIAIMATTNGNGSWEYSTNGGSNWAAVGSVTNSSALLLRSTDLVRFVPNGQNATTGDITFRAWDQTGATAGQQGTKVDVSTNGGTTAFSSATEIASITVTAVNDNPIAVTDTATAVESGGVSNGTAGTNPTGNVLANDTDVDSGDTQTVSGVAAGTVGSASGSVASNVTGTYGLINIAANGSYTYTVDNSNATVQALRTASNTITDVFTYTMQDAGGLTSTTQITVTIQGANDTPHDLATTGLTVAENSANSTSVGTITRSDLDASDTPSYSLVDSAGGRFAINSSTGVVTVANSSLLNYEAATSHSITVRVTDLSGATYDEVFAVNLTDVDEFDVNAPTDINATANSVNENVAIGTAVGITASATDADATTNAVTYSLFNSDGGNFEIDANTGIVTTAAALNRETLGATRNITVRATSSDGSTADSVFTININDLDEFDTGAVSDTNAAANSVVENAANGTVVGIMGLATDARRDDQHDYVQLVQQRRWTICH